MGRIGDELSFVETYEMELNRLGVFIMGEDPMITRARADYQVKLAKANQTISDLNDFHDYITKHWTSPSQRILGYVLHAPPISLTAGPKQFVEDWALIDLNLDKIDWATFKGNVVYLGTF